MIPKTMVEALSVKDATFIGGGTDIMPLLKNHVRDDRRLVFTGSLPELQGIHAEGGNLFIGAGVALFDIACNETVRAVAGALAYAAALTASPQIRNIATIGGNVMQDRRCIYFNQSRFWRSALPLCFKTGGSVCHQIPNSPVCRAIYYSDTATALLALDADVEFMENGAARRMDIGSFLDRHTEANGLEWRRRLPVLLTRFIIPMRSAKSAFYKYAMRSSIDFPLVNFAVSCDDTKGTRVAVGAVASRPQLARETAALFEDADRSDEDVLAVFKNEFAKISRPIREAIIPPGIKREFSRLFTNLLPLRRTMSK